MRIANLAGRLAIVHEAAAVDVEQASGGRFGPDPQAVYAQWAEFRAWAAGASLPGGDTFRPADLQAPVPAPDQVFAIGLNYRDHAAESGFTEPLEPPVFTKFRGAITGPFAEVKLPADTVDWEVEMVVVIGAEAYQVPAARAWDHVAGLTIGQDLSERVLQAAGPAPQFSLGKSFPGFAPTGPYVVTTDEVADPGDLELGCAINGEKLQGARTSDMIFGVPVLIERLSAVLPLSPGDIIFTGTPSGVGMGRSPRRFIRPGDQLTSWIEGLGEMKQSFIAGPRHTTVTG